MRGEAKNYFLPVQNERTIYPACRPVAKQLLPRHKVTFALATVANHSVTILNGFCYYGNRSQVGYVFFTKLLHNIIANQISTATSENFWHQNFPFDDS